MSRIANSPIELPANVEVKISARSINVKGSKGNLEHVLPPVVQLVRDGSALKVTCVTNGKTVNMLAGTTRAIVSNMVVGVSRGFMRKLQLVGVGYRAKVQGEILNLTLGFSHPVDYPIPEGIAIETPTQTEIIVSGIDKQKIGQVAAEIRAYRPPEPYKGKGIRYADEQVVRKEAKKK